MREIILYIAQSVDGYIATEEGSVSWLSEYENPEYDFNSFYDTVDVCVMGRNTYKQVVTELAPNNWPYKGKETLVLSSHPIEDPNIQSLNVDELIEVINHIEGKVWVVGGSMLLRFFLENNWIDKMIITTIPILLGKGISLFEKIDNIQKYKIIKVDEYSNMVETTYKRLN